MTGHCWQIGNHFVRTYSFCSKLPVFKVTYIKGAIMSESQQRYSTELTDEYHYKYRPKRESTFSLFKGSDFDLQQKTLTGLKYGLYSGILAAIVSFEAEIPFVLSRQIERSFKHGTPWVICGTMYGLTVATAANIRHKEDLWNHALGGAAAGAVMGSWYRSPLLGQAAAVIFAAVAGGMKYATDIGHGLMYDVRKEHPINLYRTGWFVDRPDPEGIRDEDKNDSFRSYKP